MPKREDERWAVNKEHLRYCSRHEQYYKVDVGCQHCSEEKLAFQQSFLKSKRTGDSQELEQCPGCKKKSLFWNNDTKHYECLNAACVEPEELTPI